MCRYGGSGAHSRTADLLVYNCTSQELLLQATTGQSIPLMLLLLLLLLLLALVLIIMIAWHTNAWAGAFMLMKAAPRCLTQARAVQSHLTCSSELPGYPQLPAVTNLLSCNHRSSHRQHSIALHAPKPVLRHYVRGASSPSLLLYVS